MTISFTVLVATFNNASWCSWLQNGKNMSKNIDGRLIFMFEIFWGFLLATQYASSWAPELYDMSDYFVWMPTQQT